VLRAEAVPAGHAAPGDARPGFAAAGPASLPACVRDARIDTVENGFVLLFIRAHRFI